MTLMLIAGAWHGAWCWDRVAADLTARGHRVVTPELPGTGADSTDARSISLAGWADFVAGRIALEDREVVLVGHSRGGAVISEVAERVPARLRRLVYVAGYLLPSGETVADAARADSAALIAPHMIPAQRGVTCRLDPAIVRDALYGRCTAEDSLWAEFRLTPEPLRPLATPLRVTPENFGRVPRAYVECSADRAVTPAAQRAMLAALPCNEVLTLDTDHSPFLSRPAALAEWLAGL